MILKCQMIDCFKFSLSQNRGWITWFGKIELSLYHLIAGASFEAVPCFFQQILVGQRFPVGWTWMQVRFLDWLLHIQPGVDFDTLFQQIWVRGLYEITGSYSYCRYKIVNPAISVNTTPLLEKIKKGQFCHIFDGEFFIRDFLHLSSFCPKKTWGLLSYFNRRS